MDQNSSLTHLSGARALIYGNQVTYSVHLSNGMVVTRPEEFPNDKDEQVDLVEAEEESAR
jgi:hypothetical protein